MYMCESDWFGGHSILILIIFYYMVWWHPVTSYFSFLVSWSDSIRINPIDTSLPTFQSVLTRAKLFLLTQLSLIFLHRSRTWTTNHIFYEFLRIEDTFSVKRWKPRRLCRFGGAIHQLLKIFARYKMVATQIEAPKTMTLDCHAFATVMNTMY